ncbi:MAG: hypothetical protein GY829_12405 [Gammaproteobacteria bacterium]|nr:hypothetical protein [Gammaproteobacteria bacterium]
MDRYTGKPFLRLIECYVLNSIDQLDDAQRSTLIKMEPKLSGVYNIQGSWLEIVSAQMEFPETFPDQIRDFWNGYLEHAKSQGQSVDPNEFAISFVDQNFPDAVA